MSGRKFRISLRSGRIPDRTKIQSNTNVQKMRLRGPKYNLNPFHGYYLDIDANSIRIFYADVF